MKQLTMKEIQNGALEVLKKVADICDELNLKYCLIYGTLIGAIRHKGFIPWDDDIDIMMPREDYNKLLKYFMENREKLLPYELLSNYNKKDYPYMISRISDSRYYLDVNNEEDYGCGLFIDVYPYDGLGNDKKEMKKFAMKADHTASFCFQSTREKYEKGDRWWKTVLKLPVFCYAKMRGQSYFAKKSLKLAERYSYDESKYVGCVVWISGGLRDVYLREWFDEIIDGEFEGCSIKIPKRYDEILRHCYGDYMKLPPEEERIGHHFYKAYEKE